MYHRVGMGFSNWRTSPGDPCSEVSNGQQRCFRTTTVDGQPPEQAFAQAQGCVARGDSCSTSAGNPGIVWCCPPGCPQIPGEAAPPQPCVPAAVPGFGLQRIMSNPLTWAGLAALGVAGFFMWKLKEERS